MLLTLWKSAVKVFPQQQNSLDALCKRLGVDLTSRNDGHGALIDAQLLAQVYLVLKQDQESMDIDSLTLSGKNSMILKILTSSSRPARKI